MGLQTYLPIEILDYIQIHEPAEDTPYGISQRELAKALGYHPCSMSRPLEDLVRHGLVTARRGLVRDGRRKQLVYRITPAGVTRLKHETRAVPLLTGDLPPPPHPFLGRREELDQLNEIGKGGASVTFVDGPPGMGKTALISRHLRIAKRGRVPFWFPVRSASSPRQFVSTLAHALSYLGNPQLAYYSQIPRNPAAREVADLTLRALGTQGLIAVIDDFHLAGEDLRSFIGDFVSVLTARGSHQFYLVGQNPKRFDVGEVASHQISVLGLDRASAHELTDRSGGLAERFELVFQSTLGSPLLLKLAVSNPEVSASGTALPKAVVGRLTPDQVRAVLPVALSNEPLPSSLLEVDFELDASRLNELVRIGVLHRTSQDRVEVLQVVASALLSRVGQVEQRIAHLSLARYYGRSHRTEALRERFLHLVEGEDWKAAARMLDEQESIVVRQGYSETLRIALRHLASALPIGASRVRVLIAEASLLRNHSDFPEAIRILRQSIDESGDDARMACEAHLMIVELYVRMQQLDSAKLEFSAAREIGINSRRLEALSVLTHGRIDEAEGKSGSASAQYKQAYELSRKIRATDLVLETITAWSRVAELTGGPEASLRLIESALPSARQAGRLDIVFNLLIVRARAYSEMGRLDLAETDMNSIRSEAESLGYLTQLMYSLSGLVAMAVEKGRWVEGGSFAKQAGALAERLGNNLVLGHTLALLCNLEFRQVEQGGDQAILDEALVHGQRSIEVLSRLPPTDSIALAHGYLVEVLLHLGRRSEALSHYRSSIQTAEEIGAGWLKERIISELGARVSQSASV
jgi:tetratricopeptide (TPR) repeat protein/DNA-binding MarR family transcriptional regulator